MEARLAALHGSDRSRPATLAELEARLAALKALDPGALDPRAEGALSAAEDRRDDAAFLRAEVARLVAATQALEGLRAEDGALGGHGHALLEAEDDALGALLGGGGNGHALLEAERGAALAEARAALRQVGGASEPHRPAACAESSADSSLAENAAGEEAEAAAIVRCALEEARLARTHRSGLADTINGAWEAGVVEAEDFDEHPESDCESDDEPSTSDSETSTGAH